MKHLAVCLCCGFLLPFVWLSEQRQRRQRQLVGQLHQQSRDYLAKAVADTLAVRPRVAVWIFPTPHGNDMGWRVRASCPEEAAEILSLSEIFRPASAS